MARAGTASVPALLSCGKGGRHAGLPLQDYTNRKGRVLLPTPTQRQQAHQPAAQRQHTRRLRHNLVDVEAVK
jgi:hypothetical protein